jgi:hypothetical protein
MDDDRKYSSSEDVVDATNVVAEVTHLKTTLSLYHHLVRAPLSETCHQVCTCEEVISWIRVSWVTHTGNSNDLTDECKGHIYRSPPKLGTK